MQKTSRERTIMVVNAAPENKTAEILLYGYIGGDDVVALDFVRELRALEKTCDLINIRINSVGGSIFDGFAIFNAIRAAKCNVDTYIDGIAASMASVIALAGRKCYMSKVARYMSHRASGGCFGNADELRTNAELLEGLESDISNIYAARTGLTPEEAKAKYLPVGKDRWITAQEALSEKIIDGIYDAPMPELNVPQDAKVEDMWEAYAAITPTNSIQTETLFVL